ncbi:XdhC family protein [Paenibacillus sp. sgz302251]|uniref:XdhC family protein n=1 Tax=Paenibacillus sp. sgz302251 TaxID=3414493 RepID=UPI003C7AD22C
MDMQHVLMAVKADDLPSVLATIVCVEGHSYRKAGASMLIKLNGEQTGTLSPGCLELDLFERAQEVWDSGCFSFIEYNMKPEEDVIWGEAIGCGGKISLLLEPVNERLRPLLLHVLSCNAAGMTVRLNRTWKENEMKYVLDVRDAAASALKDWNAEEPRANGLSMVISPRPRLVLFGAGKDADAIYSLVNTLGFQVFVADWRSSLCTKERYPEAECVIGTPEMIMEQLQLRADDYLIVCSHNLYQDKEMLRLTLPLQLVYIGIMGSKQRIRLLFETFLIPSNVSAPIGLPIGADGPDEIAVSVAAELIAVRARRNERPRRETVKDGYFGAIFSSGTEQKNGFPQASDGADAREAAWKHGAACADRQPT